MSFKKIIILISMGLTLVGLIFFKFKIDSSNLSKLENESVKTPQNFDSNSNQNQISKKPLSKENTTESKNPTNDNPPHSFKEQFTQISHNIGKTSNNPEAEDAKISELALYITPDQLNELYEVVTSKYSNGDEKLLAIELMIRSPLNDTINMLKEFAKTPLNQITSSSSLQNEGRALQMMSVEGLAHKSDNKPEARRALNDIAQSTQDSALNDRVQRALWALDGKGPYPEVQDEEALKKVLTGNR